MKTNQEFEKLAREYLTQHPRIDHVWRPIQDKWSGDRTDLVCDEGKESEVFASLRETAIAVGDKLDHTDYEDFGRGLTSHQLAAEAMAYFIELLGKHGVISNSET
jgi:hypothetical protein